MKTATPSLARLWRAYSIINRREFRLYNGACSCWNCQKYRQDFDRWVRSLPPDPEPIALAIWENEGGLTP